MVKYFKKGLKPSIKAKKDQDNNQLIDYKELVAKAVKAKAKAGLQPSFYIQETVSKKIDWPIPLPTKSRRKRQ